MQSMVDIDIACTIAQAVKRNGFQKVVLITGDKDFVPMLDYIENDAEIWVLGFKDSVST